MSSHFRKLHVSGRVKQKDERIFTITIFPRPPLQQKHSFRPEYIGWSIPNSYYIIHQEAEMSRKSVATEGMCWVHRGVTASREGPTRRGDWPDSFASGRKHGCDCAYYSISCRFKTPCYGAAAAPVAGAIPGLLSPEAGLSPRQLHEGPASKPSSPLPTSVPSPARNSRQNASSATSNNMALLQKPSPFKLTSALSSMVRPCARMTAVSHSPSRNHSGPNIDTRHLTVPTHPFLDQDYA
jgi:hypothetical protein